MRCLNKNKRPVYYALYKGKTPITDADGNLTGEFTLTYTEPIMAEMNVSQARGTADVEQFGINTPYTHTIVTDQMDCPIDTDSILWIYRTPDNNVKHNYAVTKVARALTSITYAVQEVDVD